MTTLPWIKLLPRFFPERNGLLESTLKVRRRWISTRVRPSPRIGRAYLTTATAAESVSSTSSIPSTLGSSTGGAESGIDVHITARTPLEEYDSKVAEGRLRDDPYQRKIISNLSILHTHLSEYIPPNVVVPLIESLVPSVGVSGFFGLFFGGGKKKEENSTLDIGEDGEVKGIYLYGDVGCGKTMLMDLFYGTIPYHLPKKRLHFHQFMQHLHKRSHEIKVKYNHNDMDVIPLLASEIAKESTVLCFDEFQVTDVADAMLLRRLFALLLSKDYGVVLFATSNRAPDDLYLNGIQRATFIPCIQQIKRNTRVIFLNSPTDYRKISKPMSLVYYTPAPGVKWTSKTNQAKCRKHVDDWYSYFNQGNKCQDIIQRYKLKVWGRDLVVPLSSYPQVAQFTFEELCGKPLAAGDYLTLATSFQSFIITDIPYLSIEVRDHVRRFITFLDAVYDAHGRIATTGAAPFKDLFVEPEDLKSGNYQLFKKQMDTGIEETFEEDELVTKHGFDKEIAKKASMFANDEEKFAFARALSRLSQMATQDWIETVRSIT